MNAVDTIRKTVTAEPIAVQHAIAAAIVAPVAAAPAPHGIVDDGYAADDHTSRWIERVGEAEFV